MSPLQGQLSRADIGSVTEHDDRKVVVHEPLNSSSKPYRLAVMPHPGMPFVVVQEPAKAILCRAAIGLLRRTIRYFHRCDRGAHLSLTQQAVAAQCPVPFFQVR